jgi:hypothetical protein
MRMTSWTCPVSVPLPTCISLSQSLEMYIDRSLSLPSLNSREESVLQGRGRQEGREETTGKDDIAPGYLSSELPVMDLTTPR